MSTPRARRLDYAISLDHDGRVAAEAGEGVALAGPGVRHRTQKLGVLSTASSFAGPSRAENGHAPVSDTAHGGVP